METRVANSPNHEFASKEYAGTTVDYTLVSPDGTRVTRKANILRVGDLGNRSPVALWSATDAETKNTVMLYANQTVDGICFECDPAVEKTTIRDENSSPANRQERLAKRIMAVSSTGARLVSTIPTRKSAKMSVKQKRDKRIRDECGLRNEDELRRRVAGLTKELDRIKDFLGCLYYSAPPQATADVYRNALKCVCESIGVVETDANN